jgi:hypothetical protein
MGLGRMAAWQRRWRLYGSYASNHGVAKLQGSVGVLEQVVRSAETEAKLVLLRHLKSAGLIDGTTSIATELNVAKQENRADIVLISKNTVCYEIKSRRDTLTRLDQQVSAFGRVFDQVYIVAASKHLNAVLTRVPDYVGLLEIVYFGADPSIRTVREAEGGNALNVDGLLDLLPVAVLRRHLATLLDVGLPTARREIVELARTQSLQWIRSILLNFLSQRYAPSTHAFKAAVSGRMPIHADLSLLRAWGGERAPDQFPLGPKPCAHELDRQIYHTIGDSFGPVPEDIRAALRG